MKGRMKSKDVKNRDFYITSIPDTTMNRDGDICPLEPEEEYVVIKKEKLEDTRSESTRLNSSHVSISYAVFCLKKKKTNTSVKCLLVRLIYEFYDPCVECI